MNNYEIKITLANGKEVEKTLMFCGKEPNEALADTVKIVEGDYQSEAIHAEIKVKEGF